MKNLLSIIVFIFLFSFTMSSCKKENNITTTTAKIDSTLVTLYNTITINNQFVGGAAFVDLDNGDLFDMTSADYPDAIDNQDKIDAVYYTYGTGINNSRVFINPFELCGTASGTAANLCNNQYNGISKWSIKNNTQFNLTTITYSQLLQIKYNFQLDSVYNKSVKDDPSYFNKVAGLYSGDVYRFKTNLGKGLFVISNATGEENTLGELIISILYLKDK